jgi:hypothetical protein
VAWPQSAGREGRPETRRRPPRPAFASGKISRQARADQDQQPGGGLGHGENIEFAEYIEGEPGEVGRESRNAIVENCLNGVVSVDLPTYKVL